MNLISGVDGRAGAMCAGSGGDVGTRVMGSGGTVHTRVHHLDHRPGITTGYTNQHCHHRVH